MIKVVGLGPGSKDALTLGTLDILKSGASLYLRTFKHPTVEYLKEINIEFQTFDNKYDTLNNFDEVYLSIANELVDLHKKQGDIVYAVPGHPLVAEKSVKLLMEFCDKENIPIDILPAVSFIDAMMEALKLDAVEGIKIIDAFDINKQVMDKRIGVIITQVYNKLIASEVKLSLLEYYKDDTEIFFVRAAGVKGEESIRKIPLYQLDRQEDVDYLTSLYIPRDLSNTLDYHDLLGIMDTLRDEGGCPWDREQTHESLRKYLIEECYEVIEAIDEQDESKLVEELGDVLLQVVFHARLGKEDGYFDMRDVIGGICTKMIERHPHIFSNTIATTSEEVLTNWEEIKRQEKGFETHSEVLKHVPRHLPALMRAEKVQKKAAKVGFDWEKIEDAMSKVLEELDEIRNVYNGNDRAKIIEEVGDLIFSSVNVSRFLDIDPEFALNYTIDKFIKRFQYIEEAVIKKGMKLEEMSLQQMDDLWNEAKNE